MDPRLDLLVSHAAAAERDAKIFTLVVELFRDGHISGASAVARFENLEQITQTMRTTIDDIVSNP